MRQGTAPSGPFSSLMGMKDPGRVKPCQGHELGSFWCGMSYVVDAGGCHRMTMRPHPCRDMLLVSVAPSQKQPRNPGYWSRSLCSPVTRDNHKNNQNVSED